jgi:type II secretory pathway pseudopilin PulG
MSQLVVVLLIGLACGYGVRELISRRRRAAARKRVRAWKAIETQIDNFKLMAKLATPPAETDTKR